MAGQQEQKIIALSAQFEHSVGVTSTGYEIFTLSEKLYTTSPIIDFLNYLLFWL